MKHYTYLLSIGLLLLAFLGCENYDDDPIFPASDFIAEGEYQGEYWPTVAWRTCDPKDVGMDPKKLKELNEEIRLLLEMEVEIHSMVIIRKGYIVAEQYYSEEYGPDDMHRIHSCTKSITSALLGISLGQGLLNSVDEKMLSFFPEYNIENLSEDKKNISLEHLLTMSSGLEWYEIEYPYGDSRNTFRQWYDGGARVKFVLDLPVIAAPGEEFSYSSGSSHVLSAVVKKLTGIRADSFAMEHLLSPIGIDEIYWPTDDEGVPLGGAGARLTPRNMARFGYLYLKNGSWDGKQIVPADWVELSQQKHMPRKYIPDSYYGYQFWVSDYGAYSAVGYQGQWITIVPEHDLVVIFNNKFVEGDDFQWSTPERLLTTYIIPAIQ
ncbi:MAG: serine hydrolase [Bacteroides sp.]|nr:serine hydrolase [Bacteroides sp.]